MACEDCGVDPNKVVGVAMVAMMPGRDGSPWEYCLKCFLEGCKPHKVGNFKAPTVITDEKLYDALVSASARTPGLNPADSPKDDVADFERKPRKRKAS